MVHNIILILVGFVLWKFIPGKITAASKKGTLVHQYRCADFRDYPYAEWYNTSY